MCNGRVLACQLKDHCLIHSTLKNQILCFLSAFLCVYVHVGVHVCMVDRGQPQVSFYRSQPSSFLRQGL